MHKANEANNIALSAIFILIFDDVLDGSISVVHFYYRKQSLGAVNLDKSTNQHII